jgi:hypothetical protein
LSLGIGESNGVIALKGRVQGRKTAARQWLIWGRHGGGAVDLVVGIGAATGVERRAAVLLHFIDLPLQGETSLFALVMV